MKPLRLRNPGLVLLLGASFGTSAQQVDLPTQPLQTTFTNTTNSSFGVPFGSTPPLVGEPWFEIDLYGEGTIPGGWGKGLLLRRASTQNRGSAIVWDCDAQAGTNPEANNFFIAGPQALGGAFAGDYFGGLYRGAANAGNTPINIWRVDGNDGGTFWQNTDPQKGHTQYMRDLYLLREAGTAIHPRLGINVGEGTIATSLHVGCQPGSTGTGTVRFECLDPNITATQSIVCDAQGNLTYGILPAGADCDWERNAAQDVITAYATAGSNGTCPEEDNAVGIGTLSPTAKLHVETDDFAVAGRINSTMGTEFNEGLNIYAAGGWGKQDGLVINTVAPGTPPCAFAFGQDYCTNVGIRTTQSGTVYRSRGVIATTSGATWTAYAGIFTANDAAPYSWGLQASAVGGSSTSYGIEAFSTSTGSSNHGAAGSATGAGTTNYGLRGYACAANTNYGVFGETCTTGANDWAGWFEGNVMINGSGFLPGMVAIMSDAALKRNVTDLKNAGELLGKLRPTTYEFAVDEHPSLNLVRGIQFGLIAQEVERVIPEIVKPVLIPAQRDSSGNILVEQQNLKAVQYEAIIPLLIAGYKEQQAAIEDLKAELEALRTHRTADDDLRSDDGSKVSAESAELTISPNPFEYHTTISYSVGCDCRVQLQVTTADGKPRATLLDEQRAQGSYTHEWDTTALAAGMYYCTLLVDGKPTVKRAVKVTR